MPIGYWPFLFKKYEKIWFDFNWWKKSLDQIYWKHYKNISLKKKRPYLVIKPQMKNNFFIAVPLTDVYSDKGTKKIKKEYWLEYKFRKESYIQFDMIRIFNTSSITNGDIMLTNSKLKSSYKKIALKKIQDFFS